MLYLQKNTFYMKERIEIMKTWLVWGIGLEKIEIVADSFDSAIKFSRKINENYNTAQLKD